MTPDNRKHISKANLGRDRQLARTLRFHAEFEQGIPPCPCVKTNTDKLDLYASLIQEELTELMDELEAGNEVGVLDALCDLQVVLDGAWIQSGMHVVKAEAMEEVYNSNMSKIGEDGLPIIREDGKIMKGPNYFKPDLKKILEDWKVKHERTR